MSTKTMNPFLAALLKGMLVGVALLLWAVGCMELWFGQGGWAEPVLTMAAGFAVMARALLGKGWWRRLGP